VAFDAYRSPDFEALMEAWVPITVALNSLNRSMGLPDLYPFVIAPPVVTKLGFVHELVHSASAALRGQADWPSEDVRRRA
jgi:hypothetical protein